MRNIVSVTSYGKRLNTLLPITLKSIFNQNGFEPDKIVVYLAEKDYNNIDGNLFKEMPSVEFRVVSDYKSYKKYFALTDSEFDNDIVWVIDDDIEFSSNAWENFKKAYDSNDNKNIIYTTELYKIVDGEKIPVKKSNEGLYHFIGRCNFFSPNVGRITESVIGDGFRLVPTWDDIFLSVYFCNKELKFQNIGKIYSRLKRDNYYDSLTFKNKGTYNGSFERVLRFFEYSKNDFIVSVSAENNTALYDKIISLFNQSLKPNKVILTLKTGEKLKKKVSNLTKTLDFEIQYTDLNPNDKKWIPDNVSNDSLLFVLDGSKVYPENFLMQLYKDYNRNVITIGKKMQYFKGFGHQYIVNDIATIIPTRYLIGLDCSDEDFLIKITENVLKNGSVVRTF